MVTGIMSSETDILNTALILIGEQPVLTADNTTKQGRRFVQIYPMMRDSLLAAHFWNFALSRASLAALSTAPAWGYTYQYQLPSDCLSLVQVGLYAQVHPYYLTTDTSPYKVEGGMILTELVAPLDIRYIKRVTDTAQFHPSFVEMLSLKIALGLNQQLTNDTGLYQTLIDSYKSAKAMALRGNAIEKAQQQAADSDTILTRL